MAINGNKTVYFFKLNLRQDNIVTNDNKEEVVKYRYLNENEFISCVNDIYDNTFKPISNGNKAVLISTNTGDIIIECVEKETTYCILKIGHNKAYNTVEVRNSHNLNSYKVPIDIQSESLELYTYCFIDFKTQVCAIIYVHGAPKIHAVNCLFSQYFSDKKPRIFVTTDTILSEEIIKILAEKDIITQITATIAVPNDELLTNIIGQERSSFGEFQNIKNTDITFAIKANRNKNIFRKSNHLIKMYNVLSEKFGDSLKKLNVRAKNYTESSQKYDVLNYKFTKSIDLGTDNNIDDDVIIKFLKRSFTNSIDEIKFLIGENNEK